MAQLSEHPSVKRFYQERANGGEAATDQVLDAAWLRQLCLDAGADDVGFVERDRPDIADQRADIDTVEAAWKIVDPVLGDTVPVHPYAKGTWGPKEADRLLPGRDAWHDPAG